jgi:S1-C subfamily serine protease
VKKREFQRNSQLFLDPYFERFFGLDLSKDNQPRIEQSQGSGFIFADGLVMTNAHVVNGSDKVIVGLTNGKKLNAKLIGQDFFTDLAVLKIEGKGPWPKAQLGDSTKIKVGDWAIAVGNPFGLENTVTLGIISNLNRNVTQLGIYDKKLELIQTDAAINPGNSGGPLLNSNGEVIGINTLIRSGPGAGLSFAIPINKAKEIAYQLINNGKVIHPMIGISLIDSSDFETNKNAVKVGYVVPNSPAEKSGIMVNDEIIKVGNKNIETASDVINKISENGVNKKIKILLKRKNKFISLKVTPTDITNLKNN